jgi:hypothetical protein
MTTKKAKGIRPMKPDVPATIAALQESEQRGVAAATVFYGLSDLTPAQIERIAPYWMALDVELRRKMMRRMAETSENDIEMNYHAVGIMGLSDPDAEVRQAAIDVLWEDESLALMNQLVAIAANDNTNFVRASALSALGRFILAGELGDLPEESTLPAQDVAIRLLKDEREEVDVRRRALEAIANSSSDFVPGAIRKAYRSGDPKMQVSAIFAMGRTYDEQWEEIVLQEIENEDPEFRFEAARAAGELELTGAVPKLAKLLAEDDPEIREMAVWSLGEIGGKEAVRILQVMLEAAEEAEDEDMIAAVEDAIGTASLADGNMFSLWTDEN